MSFCQSIKATGYFVERRAKAGDPITLDHAINYAGKVMKGKTAEKLIALNGMQASGLMGKRMF